MDDQDGGLFIQAIYSKDSRVIMDDQDGGLERVHTCNTSIPQIKGIHQYTQVMYTSFQGYN